MAKVEAMGNNIWKITEDFVASYLVVGEEEALMIDTGIGTCDLQAIVKEHTDLPCKMAVLTHNHYDHLCGVDAFDMVHCHINHLEELMKKFKSMPYAVMEGFRFNLGGRTLYVIDLPGHSAGNIGLFDEENRIFFTGDVLCDGPVYMYSDDASMPDFVASLDKLMTYGDKVDRWLGSHESVPMDLTWAEKLKALALDIMAGREEEGVIINPDGDKDVRWVKGHGVSFYLEIGRDYKC